MVHAPPCSGITVYNALEKIGFLRDGEWLAVMGCGGLGLNAIAIARAMEKQEPAVLLKHF